MDCAARDLVYPPDGIIRGSAQLVHERDVAQVGRVTQPPHPPPHVHVAGQSSGLVPGSAPACGWSASHSKASTATPYPPTS